MTERIPRLALGAIPYYWSREQIELFYAQVADAPVEIVYIGETVCAKRKEMRTRDWLALGEELAAAGKDVVLSTLVLLEAEADLRTLRRICANGRFMVEANDMGAVRLLQGESFVAGPGINIYNDRALTRLAALGLKRWVFPVELARDTLVALQAIRPAYIETEMFVYGRIPLAYSARCFTARHLNLQKDDCGFCCHAYPDGLLVSSQEGAPFLNLNGIQTQSAQTYNLLTQLPELIELGIDVLRIGPQREHTLEIIEIFDRVRRGEGEPQDFDCMLEGYAPVRACNGYWHDEPGISQHDTYPGMHPALASQDVL
ncbi:MAG: U32 family peptidase [Pseudomonadota bacterium]|nr:MAG: U32 family peptidase [Pseudomonadota bacterium]